MIKTIIIYVIIIFTAMGCDGAANKKTTFEVDLYPANGSIISGRENINFSYSSKIDFDSVVLMISKKKYLFNKAEKELSYFCGNSFGKIPYMISFYKDSKRDSRSNYFIHNPSKPEYKRLDIIKKISRSGTPHTQGYTIDNGVIYESSGEYGKSYIQKVDLKTMRSIAKTAIDGRFYAEGCTIIGDNLYVLTWMEKTILVFNKNSLKLLKTIPITTDGWGLTTDGEYLYYSDGSQYIYKMSPEDFKILEKTEVFTNDGALSHINEMEWIDGYIYANIFTTNLIAKINPVNGVVKTLYDVTGLWEPKPEYYTEDVMNGIAYDSRTKKIYVTGKKWDIVYEVKF